MMSEVTKNENNFVGYEYKDVTVKRSIEPVYADVYANFGWTLEDTSTPLQGVNSVTMKFKRDRKIRNKAELSRLSRQFDACVAEIDALERSKVNGASIAAFTIGIIGSAFLASSVFAYTGGSPFLCILLAVPGFVGWILPYFCYCGIRKRKTDRVAPLIDKKYDEIYEVCEKANGLLAK
jgi:hypothetical protein